jgi:deazaflavin-dependent oxidoreductase (nitroreductase family)
VWGLVLVASWVAAAAVPADRSERLDAIRRFNKRWLNPVMLRMAGCRHWYAARLEHVGRRSGRRFATPIVARPVRGGFAVPLPYGRSVDWLRNLEAAGRGELVAAGRRYVVTEPRVLPGPEVAEQLSPLYRRMAAGDATGFWLVLKAVPVAAADLGGAGAPGDGRAVVEEVAEHPAESAGTTTPISPPPASS